MRPLIIASLAALAVATGASAAPNLERRGNWNLDSNAPGRFVAQPGHRSVIMGYPSTGLEVWTYPLQLLSGYHVRFRETGRVEPLEGRTLLSRIETSPSEVVRIYSGPDFVVRERLFVPLDAPAAIITYEVDGRPDVQIEARFHPSLDLMWPGALGGQDVGWNDARTGYVEREPLHGFSAIIRSPETIAHDSIINAASNRPEALSLLLQPRREADGIRRARVLVSQDQPGSRDEAIGMENRSGELRAQADAHYASVLDQAVQITTPDPEVNRALESAILAVDQAWVCAPQIGCGNVGGYGPSRPARRPQYAWFFAGDGLVAVKSFLAAGRYEHAREELEFIARYQNKTNGMIWHEMSTSAPLVDWEKRYPYMFVHVDITLQYLSTLADYVETTGDTAFLKAHWTDIRAAWHYARTLIDSKTGLPSIPAGKEGQNEQAVMRDDVHLSSAWIEAADGFAKLARVERDARLAREGDDAAKAAREAVRTNYWDAQNGFWFGGHTVAGEPIREQRPDAMDVLLQGAFSDAQAGQALDRIATPEFQTDWGVRSLSANHPDYDPNAYASGAVWGLGSSGVASVFWKEHRPFTAWNAWHGLVSWSTLDSPGHLHEVTAGDLYHPEIESVPEQTWSSAGFLSTAVDGLLGLQIHGAAARLTFAPHLPADWDDVSIKRLRVGSSLVDLQMHEDGSGITLKVDDHGVPVIIDFAPQAPLGARLLGAEVNGVAIPVTIERTLQDEHARLSIPVASGVTRVTVRYDGGIRIMPVEKAPKVGDRSLNVKLVSASWLADNRLILKAYVVDAAHASVDIMTPMRIASVSGADVSRIAAARYRLKLHVPDQSKAESGTYAPVEVTAKFESGAPGS